MKKWLLVSGLSDRSCPSGNLKEWPLLLGIFSWIQPIGYYGYVSSYGHFYLWNTRFSRTLLVSRLETLLLKWVWFRRNDTRACGPGAQMIIYGWDRDALPFDFPEGWRLDLLEDLPQKPSISCSGTGIAVGKNTPYKYIVVNIHYLPIVKHDYSGNQLIITRKRFVSISIFRRE